MFFFFFIILIFATIDARPLLLSLSISSTFIEDIPTNLFREAFSSKSSEGFGYEFSTAESPKFPDLLKVDSSVHITNPTFHVKFGNNFGIFSVRNFHIKSDSKILSSLPFPFNREYEINLSANVSEVELKFRVDGTKIIITNCEVKETKVNTNLDRSIIASRVLEMVTETSLTKFLICAPIEMGVSQLDFSDPIEIPIDGFAFENVNTNKIDYVNGLSLKIISLMTHDNRLWIAAESNFIKMKPIIPDYNFNKYKRDIGEQIVKKTVNGILSNFFQDPTYIYSLIGPHGFKIESSPGKIALALL